MGRFCTVRPLPGRKAEPGLSGAWEMEELANSMKKIKGGGGGIQGFKKYGDDQKFLRQGEAVTRSLGFPGMWLGVWGLEHLEEGV